jgi:hypothetical protein
LEQREILNELALVSALSKNLEIRLRRGHDSKMCGAAFKEISQHAQKARELIDDALPVVCESSLMNDSVPSSSKHSLELDPKIGKWHLQFEDEEAWLEDSVSIRNLVFILCNQNRAICPTEINPVNGNTDVASNRKRVHISLRRFTESFALSPLEKFNKEIERIVRRPDSFSYYPSVVWDRINP